MVSVMLYPCILYVSLLMDLFVLCVCESFGETIRNRFGCGCYLLLHVMVVFSVGVGVGGGSLFDRPCMFFQRMCVLCVLCV